jgi:hypothetical protein
MGYAIGQTIVDVISLRDDNKVALLGLLEDDFSTLEAFSVSNPATIELVGLEEINEGQYSVLFTPSTFGPWSLHYIYDVPPTFREESRVYSVAPTSEIVVVTSGGTWTYSGDLTDPLQIVRFLIQDTDGDYPLFTDNEVSYALGAANGTERRAAASLVERLMARYAAMADTTELDLSVRASQLYDHAKDLLYSLNNTFSGLGGAIPYAGGISYSDVLAGNSDPDRVRGVFDPLYYNVRSEYGGRRGWN